jgi:hypothetical protein
MYIKYRHTPTEELSVETFPETSPQIIRKLRNALSVTDLYNCSTADDTPEVLCPTILRYVKTRNATAVFILNFEYFCLLVLP